MPDDIRRPDKEEEFEDANDGAEHGIAESDDEFDDEDELDEEDEEEDEDIDSPRGAGGDRRFTSEIGSEGGSQGDIETERRNPRVRRGSEATTTAQSDDRIAFDDREDGGSPGRERE